MVFLFSEITLVARKDYSSGLGLSRCIGIFLVHRFAIFQLSTCIFTLLVNKTKILSVIDNKKAANIERDSLKIAKP